MTKVCTLLAEHRIRKVPVMKDGKLVGIINASNITKHVLKNTQ